MARQSHLISVLELFDGGPAVWTVEQIAAELKVSVRTAYRTVAELTQAGFLDPATGAGYVLGPAFIRFDRIIRQSDPLIHVAEPAMAGMVAASQQTAASLLCRRFRDCIMCVHSVEAEEARPMGSYARGVAMPLFRGAPAKIILAFLSDRALRALYLRHEAAIRAAGADSWIEFRDGLRQVRKAGFAVTTSEIGRERVGIAAPILRAGQIVASLSLVVSPEQAEPLDALVALVTDTAARISTGLADTALIEARA